MKHIVDAIDKASITLGVNQRHASSAVINNANVQQEVNLTAEEISIAIANGLPN
jgi:hypothetical protein